MIKNYRLVYNITAIPTVYYGYCTPANEPLEFDPDKLVIPDDLKGIPVELRISLYDPEGQLIELSSNMLPAAPATICNLANKTGLSLSLKAVQHYKSTRSQN